jgi:hypothetical protein
MYTPTELGAFGGSGDFGCLGCFGGFHDLLPMLAAPDWLPHMLHCCTPPTQSFKYSKHGFRVLETLQQPDLPQNHA